jgi:ubiquitin C-terminal hydrolase
VYANQLISKECEHISVRDEPFYSISVEIKNKKDLTESFELYVEGELLSGDNKYYCDGCGAGRETLKRCCIRELPPLLTVHLKRFEFDLLMMRNKKLNDRISFPMEINMEPYTVEGVARAEAEAEAPHVPYNGPIHPPEHYQYELVGIVVHTGSADCGHYYSYIKERVPLNGSTCRWFEYNDTSVTPFDIAVCMIDAHAEICCC